MQYGSKYAAELEQDEAEGECSGRLRSGLADFTNVYDIYQECHINIALC